MPERWRTPAWFALGWVGLGVVAGVLESLAEGRGVLGSAPWLPLTGLLWMPLTFAASTLARRVPFEDTPRALFAAVHGLGALAAAYVVNGAFFAVALLLRAVPAETVVSATLSSGTRWLHLHAAGWAAVVVLVTWSDRRSKGDSRDRLTVPRGRGGLSVPHDEIDWIEADGDYVRLHVGARSHLVALRMHELENELSQSRLIRVHRSAFVNVDRVREVRHRSHGDYEAVLTDGTVVRVSRRRREPLLAAIEP